MKEESKYKSTMKLDTRKLFLYIVGIFLTVLITKPLPHTSYSLIEYIIRPFRFNNSTVNLSGFIPLLIFIFCIRGIYQLDKFKNNKFITLLVIVIALIPIMNRTIDITRRGYHYIRRDGLNSVDFEKSNISFVGNDNIITLNVNIVIKDYGRGNKDFKVRVYLPKTLSEPLNLRYYELDNSYTTYGGNNRLVVKEEIILPSDSSTINNLIHTNWYQEKVVYELYNENQSIKIIDYRN